MRVPCRYCEGMGSIDIDRCAEIVQGRRCKKPARNDPHYFEAYPDREFIRPYCGMHGNMRARHAAQPAPDATAGEGQGG